jgi:hypothetical protein
MQTGGILLCGLFVYDIFWVFGTPVMVSKIVQHSLDPLGRLFLAWCAGCARGFGRLGIVYPVGVIWVTGKARQQQLVGARPDLPVQSLQAGGSVRHV